MCASKEGKVVGRKKRERERDGIEKDIKTRLRIRRKGRGRIIVGSVLCIKKQ